MKSSTPRVWGAVTVAAVVGVGAAVLRAPDASSSMPRAYELVELPADVDSLTSLERLAGDVESCWNCARIVYAWTPRMPLSRAGIPNVVDAARTLGLPVTLVSHEALQDWASGADVDGLGSVEPLLDHMLAADVLAHAPALVVLQGDDVVGAAILGYKTSEAYASIVAGRLPETDGSEASPPSTQSVIDEPRAPATAPARADYEAVGLPGAYFKWVPGTRLIAYESDGRIYFLDLDERVSRVGPGYIDFVPSPDGRYFVTPGPRNEGLEIYDAREVLAAMAQGRSYEVEPIFTDLRMRDQYPSVGILEQSGGRTLYRVLTSWFDGIVYRDYEVRVNPGSGASSVRPVGEVVVPCTGSVLSTPIMSQNGREVAARDEATGTTKIFEMLEGGRCREVVDLGAATSKVAWQASGQKIAFARPRRGRGAEAQTEAGIFVFDRATGTTTRVESSAEASRLAFPDFIAEGSVVFLIPASAQGSRSIFRVVDGIE